MRQFNPDMAQNMRDWAESSQCPLLRAIPIQGMPQTFCCPPFGDRIRSNFPPPIDQRLLDRIVNLGDSNPNFPRLLNPDLGPVIHHAPVSSPIGPASNVFISGIPYALDPYCQFTIPVYAMFSRGQRGLPIALGDIQDIINVILAQNETLQDYLKDRLNSVRQIASVSMDTPDKGMNLAIFNADGIVRNDYQIEVLQNLYQIQKLCQVHMLYDQLVYPLIYWTGSGGYGILQSEKPHSATTSI
jgi:hypothetical protein